MVKAGSCARENWFSGKKGSNIRLISQGICHQWLLLIFGGSQLVSDTICSLSLFYALLTSSSALYHETK